MRRLAIAAITLLCSIGAAAPPVALARHAASAARRFDYYVLSLSWSPQYCAASGGERHDAQCAGTRPFAFVLHGLWPQDEQGFPRDCETRQRPSQQIVDGMLDIMPSPQLVRHEWDTHGTCSGMDPRDYFATARRAFDSITIPPAYRGTPEQDYVAPSRLQRQFLEANPSLRASGVAVLCNGRYLQEVRICLDRDLAPRACGRDVRSTCRDSEIIVRPVR